MSEYLIPLKAIRIAAKNLPIFTIGELTASLRCLHAFKLTSSEEVARTLKQLLKDGRVEHFSDLRLWRLL